MDELYTEIRSYVGETGRFTFPALQLKYGLTFTVAKKFIERLLKDEEIVYEGGVEYSATDTLVNRLLSFNESEEESSDKEDEDDEDEDNDDDDDDDDDDDPFSFKSRDRYYQMRRELLRRRAPTPFEAPESEQSAISEMVSSAPDDIFYCWSIDGDTHIAARASFFENGERAEFAFKLIDDEVYISDCGEAYRTLLAKPGYGKARARRTIEKWVNGTAIIFDDDNNLCVKIERTDKLTEQFFLLFWTIKGV